MPSQIETITLCYNPHHVWPERQLFFLLAFIALYAATQYGQHISPFQFNDFATPEVKFAAAARRCGWGSIDILAEAMQLGVALNERDVHMTKRGPSLTVEFTVLAINPRVYKHDLVFASRVGEISRMLQLSVGAESF
jgi:hypothetical protein